MLLKTTRTALLAAFALDKLAEQESCCPKCCNGCMALYEMKISDDLDVIIRKVPPRLYESSEWWDQKSDSVNRFWLAGKWTDDCPKHSEVDGE